MRHMETIKATVHLLCVLALAGMGSMQDIRHIEDHLSRFTEIRNPAGVNVGSRERTAEYIKHTFREYGLRVFSQHFDTTMLIQGYTSTVRGENVIGIAEGSYGGPVLVVGADYDTSLYGHPLEDNGAGLATMLEVARNYMFATGPDGDFTRDRTVLFVAFDLNTKEYSDSSAGQPGSFHFVHQWLWPYLNQSDHNFVGSIILDSISKFNTEEQSQYLPYGFSETFPEAYRNIRDNEMRADFLAMVSRGTSRSKHLIDTFTANYRKHRKADLVKLQELLVYTNSQASDDTLHMIDHQAHYHFWTFQPSDYPSALPSILLTDTDQYRKAYEECPMPCPLDQFLSRRRRLALSLTNSGVVHTLLDLQAERKHSGAASVAVTMTAAWLLSAVALLLH